MVFIMQKVQLEIHDLKIYGNDGSREQLLKAIKLY